MIKALWVATALLSVPSLVQAHEVKAGNLELIHPHIRASMGQSPTTAGYLTILNHGKTADRLVSVSCRCAASVSVHEMKMTGSMASMKMVPSVEIPAGGKVTLAPGGLHLMVMGLKAPIKAGDRVEMVLTFKGAGAVNTPFEAIDRPAAKPMSDTMSDMDHMKH
jgi:periplasmic copper chaperone A